MNLITLVLCACACVTVQCMWVDEMENIKDPKKFQGDIVLDPDEDERGLKKKGHATFASIKGGRWPGGKIPYTIDRSIESKGRAAIMGAIKAYHADTCLRLTPRRGESSYLHFRIGSGCSSPVGYRSGRVNQISLARGCWYTGIVIHEIAHSIGILHEQSRPDRDAYVRILWQNIPQRVKYNFNKQTTSTVNSLGTPYDYLSIMHYGGTAFGSGRMTIQTIDPSKQRLIGQRGGFSKIDIQQIGLMYNKVCKEGGGATGGTGGGGGGGAGTGGNDCIDNKASCASWGKSGYCTGKYQDYMKQNCCLSCKKATGGGGGGGGGSNCTDKKGSRLCSMWNDRRLCVSRKWGRWMKENCCKTCSSNRG